MESPLILLRKRGEREGYGYLLNSFFHTKSIYSQQLAADLSQSVGLKLG